MSGTRCDACGRFTLLGPGASWSQSWGYDMSGYPELYDPTYRCASCTDALGVKPSNCAGSQNYSGRFADLQEGEG